MQPLSKPFDPAKIVTAADYIREKLTQASTDTLKLALDIGEHVFANFFSSDLLAFTDKGKGSPSLRALLEHPSIVALGLKHRTLAYYVSVAIQNQVFEELIAKGVVPPDVRKLNYTKRTLLLPARSHADAARIGVKAVQESLTDDDIKALVRASKMGQRKSSTRVLLSTPVKALIWTFEDVLAASSLDPKAVAKTEDLAFLVTNVLGPLSERADDIRDRWDAELESRPPSTDASAGPPDVLDFNEVFTDITGSPPPALPAPTQAEVRARLARRARKLLAELKAAPGDVAVGALVEFVQAACEVLGADDAKGYVLDALGATSKAARWYVVAEQDVELRPESLDRNRDYLCRMLAPDADTAQGQFEAAIKPYLSPVTPAGRTLRVVPLTAMLAGLPKKPTQTAYLAGPKQDRLPTLHEYVKAIRVASP